MCAGVWPSRQTVDTTPPSPGGARPLRAPRGGDGIGDPPAPRGDGFEQGVQLLTRWRPRAPWCATPTSRTSPPFTPSRGAVRRAPPPGAAPTSATPPTGASMWSATARRTQAVPVPYIVSPARTAPQPTAEAYWS